MVSHSTSQYEILKKDSFMSTQWLTKRVLSPCQISHVTLKTNRTVSPYNRGGETSPWLITAVEGRQGAVGEMASVALNTSHFGHLQLQEMTRIPHSQWQNEPRWTVLLFLCKSSGCNDVASRSCNWFLLSRSPHFDPLIEINGFINSRMPILLLYT